MKIILPSKELSTKMTEISKNGKKINQIFREDTFTTIIAPK